MSVGTTDEFRVATPVETDEPNYNTLMENECKKFGMKPVCEHPKYCKDEPASLFIGQTGHMSVASHRQNGKTIPSGIEDVRGMWNTLCNYVSPKIDSRALCDIPYSYNTYKQVKDKDNCNKYYTKLKLKCKEWKYKTVVDKIVRVPHVWKKPKEANPVSAHQCL